MSAYAGQDQRRKALNHFPPHPFLTIRLHTGTLLILPQNHESFDMRRFQIYREWHLGRGAGVYELENLRKLDWQIAAQIRDFYNSLLGGGANRLTDQQMLDWLRSEVQSTALAAFWLQDEWMLAGAVTAPAASLSPPPATLSVAQWTVKHKIEAMFAAIPGHLGPAAREQFNAFLTPQNLAIMVGFLVAGLAIQAIPGADAVADAIIAGLAYAMYGWAGLVAGYEFTKAVIQAGRAQSQPDIDHAAQEAADALITLGVTLFLAKLLEKIKVDSGKEPTKPAKTEPLKKPAPPSRVGQLLKSDSEASLQAARRTTAQDFYAQTGWPQARIDSHLSGIDFSQDVRVVELKQGDTVYQWVDPARGVGQYFSPEGMTPDQLGISGDGRVLQSLTVSKNVQVLQSTAAPVVDTWSGPAPVVTSGGGTQWFTLNKSIFIQTGSP
ncbi:polymorphic toxin type 46 domain-containing protein [Acidocella sp.]|uniref:polymorphic toxin type 46 domain-containing protein n=1 Tax=Acidocella sp. TaxID=50710 RepID=UPI003D013308